jgi:primosomal protein N' (replication factor Y)
MLYANVILPVPIPETYTYCVDAEYEAHVQVGSAVEVSFGKRKIYTAIVLATHRNKPEGFEPKPILGLLREEPVVNQAQLDLWKWMASYYCCTLGEVMLSALPALYRLSSESRIVLKNPDSNAWRDLSDQAFLIAEALSMQQELSLDDVQVILQKKSVQPVIRELMDSQIAVFREEMKAGFKPKQVKIIYPGSEILTDENLLDEEKLQKQFEVLEKKAPKQVNVLMTWLSLQNEDIIDTAESISKSLLKRKSKDSGAAINALIKKNIFREELETQSRLDSNPKSRDLPTLSEAQIEAKSQIQNSFQKHVTTLFHGVTASGKTAIYMHLIAEAIEQGKQVLYLVPEIALSTQLSRRLQDVFGEKLGIYHSRFSQQERIEVWNKVKDGSTRVIMGARSALFLPFKELGLIIVDEEHESSFKQFDPAPRYQARDSAIVLAKQFGAHCLLGSATPSLESLFNARTSKYGLVQLFQRYSQYERPQVEILDLKEATRKKQMGQNLSHKLRDAIASRLEKNEQVILFQNRRGYAPVLRCESCSWTPFCDNCDMRLTYHKYYGDLRCHLCRSKKPLPKSCPACGSHRLTYRGFGTEQVEDELESIFPNSRVARMDLDSVKGKKGHQKIINSFENREIDILIGTKMVTKGLDFTGVTLVGVLSADQLYNFPDFRAYEHAFQLLAQVSGRAGRLDPGEVIIQTWDPRHPIIQSVLQNNFYGFADAELAQRNRFHYPPYRRLIRISIKHRLNQIAQDAARYFEQSLKGSMQYRVMGPEAAHVARQKGLYVYEIQLKIEKSAAIGNKTRKAIEMAQRRLWEKKAYRSVRVIIDVDPN